MSRGHTRGAGGDRGDVASNKSIPLTQVLHLPMFRSMRYPSQLFSSIIRIPRKMVG